MYLHEVGIFRKAPDSKPLLLLKIKIKRNLRYSNKECNVTSGTFIRISVPILEVNKSALINDYENNISYSEESEQTEVWVHKCGLLQIQLFSKLRTIWKYNLDLFKKNVQSEI